MPTIVGVFREAEFSPGRVRDDAAILARTAAALGARGFAVRLGAPALALAADVDAVLAMCQSPAALATLDSAATRVPVINSARAIRNCFRTETVRLLDAAGAPFPATRIIATDAPPPAATPCWVKRGDVHAMATADVTFAADLPALRAALATLHARGIARAAIQAHVEGPVLKFYGVADGRFFRCYTDGEAAPAPIERLWEAARVGAAALELDVFGGDLVVPPTGDPMLIDVNDWPSFTRCRDDAADAIAGYVADRLAAHTDARGATAPRRAHA
ncbi:MAG: hypothetical protein HY271_13445 [Deltaproteobacteria bacterium]|nr:hypothetical protein [Deltaproteobacteria bacterium]